MGNLGKFLNGVAKWGQLVLLFSLAACSVKMNREEYLSRLSGASITLAQLPARVRGGDTLTLNLSLNATNTSGIKQTLEFAADGVNYSPLTSFSSPVTSYSWLIPTLNTSASKIRYSVLDRNNKTTITTSDLFQIDSTPPSPPAITLAASVLTGLSTTQFSVTSCSDRYRVLLNSGATPTRTDAGWLPCSTSVGSLSATLAVEGSQGFQVWAMDDVGNVSLTSTVTPNVTRDQTPPTLSLTAPVGAENLSGGTPYSITWTQSDTHAATLPISLYYSTDSGASWTNIVSTISNSGSYAWTPPTIDSDTVQVKAVAVDSVGNTTEKASADFSIGSTPPAITLTSPNGGEYWSSGVVKNITWTASGTHLTASPISLSYSGDGGSTWTSITSGVSNSGTYAWTVPNLDVNTVLVKGVVTDLSAHTAQDVSDANFTIDHTDPALTLTSLTGGGSIKGGASSSITWTASDTNFGTAPVTVEYSVNSGTSYTLIAGSLSNSGTYSWSVPSIDTTSARIRVTVTDLSGRTTTSASTSDFAIDSTPPTLSLSNLTGGQYIKGGVSNTILWSGSDLHAAANPISLFYSTDGGSSWTSIASGLANSGTYSWSTPAIDQANVKVKVTMVDTTGNTSSDQSVLNFTIDSTAPVISLSALSGPYHGGISLPIAFTLTETNSSSTQSITVEKSSDNGASWTTLTTLSSADGPLSSQSFSPNWSVDAWDTVQAKVRVKYTDLAGWSTTDTSAAFTVDSTAPNAPNLTLVSPNPTKNRPITLTAANCTDTVSILISESSTTPALGDSAWQSCSTVAGAITDTLSTGDGAKVLYAFAKDAAGNLSPYATVNITLDQTLPVVSWTTEPATNQYLRGGNTFALAFSASDATTSVSTFKLQYAADGSTFSDVAGLAASATSYSWTIPSDNTTTATLRLLAIDAAGNQSTQLSHVFNIDSSPPAAPLVTLYSASPTNSTSTLLTISDCTDRPYVLVNEGSQPNLASATWVTCSTADGAISYTIGSSQGTHTVKVWSQDAAGNISSSSGNVNVVYDSVLPVITLGSIPNPNAWGTNVTLNWTVTEATISNAKSFTVETRPDGSSSWSTLTTVPATFGPLSSEPFSTTWTIPNWTTTTAQVRVRLTDLAGNEGIATSGALTIDNYFPSVNLTGIPHAVKGGSTLPLTLTADAVSGTLDTVVLEYAADGVTFTAVQSWTPGSATFSNTYSWSVPSDNTDIAKMRLVATNTFPASSTSMSSAFSVDSIVPNFSTSAFTINGGASTTSANSLKITLKATDNITNITKFCLKKETSAPAANASCWKSVTASPPGLVASTTLNLSNYPFLIGFNPGTYSVYAWVMDEAGNISVLSNSGAGTVGQDMNTITYNPPIAPTVFNVTSSSRDAAASPLDPVLDLTAPSSSTVYVKWKATDNAAIPAGNVSIFYTLNGVNYIPITSGLSNSSNGGCTLNASITGCATVSSPTSAAYSIRVTVLDAENQSTSSSAPSMNTKPLNIIAGNTDPGFGGSATSAIIFQPGQGFPTFENSMAVSASGKFFLIENRGLIVIDPSDGLYKRYIPTTGTATDGDVATATLINPTQITMDYQDRLLIYDGDRIRRVDLNTDTISTIIGGGGSTSDGVSAASFAASSPGWGSSGLFVALPNGDIWFQNSSDYYTARPSTMLRIYKASLDKVYQWKPNGIGSAEDPSYDPSPYTTELYGLRFNPATSAVTKIISRTSIPVSGGKTNRSTSYNALTGASEAPHIGTPGYWGVEGVITGRSGEMYTGNHFESHGIYKFDGTSWNLIVGTGGQGACADGTPATSCAVDIYTFYIGENDQIYFVDRGRIRTVDSSGNVITLFGQSRSYGDGGKPESARLGSILWMDRIDDGRIVVKDESEIRIREFGIGGTISTIAGNGNSGGADTTTAASAQPIVANSWVGNYSMVVNPSTGDVFYSRNGGSVFSVLTRLTGLWSDIAGGGGTSDLSADGLPGNQISLDGYAASPVGFNGTKLVRNRYNWNGTYGENGMIKLYQISDGTQSHFAGPGGGLGVGLLQDCPDGTPIAACNAGGDHDVLMRFGWDSATSRWLFGRVGTSKIQAAAEGGNVSTFYSAPTGMSSFTYVTKGTEHYIYYCSTTNAHVRRYHFEDTTDIELLWPNNTITCGGWTMNWDPSRNTVIFPISQNGLMGIGEYYDP